MNKKILFVLLIVLLLVVPVFASNFLDKFNDGFQKISNKFYGNDKITGNFAKITGDFVALSPQKYVTDAKVIRPGEPSYPNCETGYTKRGTIYDSQGTGASGAAPFTVTNLYLCVKYKDLNSILSTDKTFYELHSYTVSLSGSSIKFISSLSDYTFSNGEYRCNSFFYNVYGFIRSTATQGVITDIYAFDLGESVPSGVSLPYSIEYGSCSGGSCNKLYIRYNTVNPCNTWSCTSWSPDPCPVSGTQTRTCTISNTCTVNINFKPAESQSCTPTATCTAADWSCTSWSPATCPTSGTQTRTCTKTTNCLTDTGKPAESQSCTPPIAVSPPITTSPTCSDSSTLFKLSSSTNAHASLYNDNTYTTRVCVNGVTINDRTCNSNNVIIKLSNTLNAHVEKPNIGIYSQKVCSDDITCAYRTSCNGDEQCVATISGDTNAHVSDCVNAPFNTKLCCKQTACSILSCEQDICNADQTGNTCTNVECTWDNSAKKCCPPGKIWDSLNNKCDYGLITVTLNSGGTTKFVWNNEVHTLKLNNIIDSNTASITVSSLPFTTNILLNEFKDVNLNSDPLNDMRIKLNSISGTSASLTYLLSDSGVCLNSNCKGGEIGTNQFCNKGLDQCSFGTSCLFWEPNTVYPVGACCPDGKRWDSTDKECKNFVNVGGSCTSFGQYDSGNVCCPASATRGFWFSTVTY